MSGGSYILVVSLTEPTSLEVGALGEYTFRPGGYAYIGSALGSGGFARLDRHRRIATGAHDARHWHIDYLLGAQAATVVEAITVPDRAVECSMAADMPGGIRPGFGCSDCDCQTHLFYSTSVEEIRKAAMDTAQRYRK